jgi:hypothetical protein
MFALRLPWDAVIAATSHLVGAEKQAICSRPWRTITAAILSAIVSKWVVVVTAAAVTTGAAVVAGAIVGAGVGTAVDGDVLGDEASVVLAIDDVGAGAAFDPAPPQDASTISRSAPVRIFRMRES